MPWGKSWTVCVADEMHQLTHCTNGERLGSLAALNAQATK